MNRSEVYFLMKLIEKSDVPAWINKSDLIRKLQDMWIDHIHNEEKVKVAS